jgi:hypothetical protein
MENFKWNDYLRQCQAIAAPLVLFVRTQKNDNIKKTFCFLGSHSGVRQNGTIQGIVFFTIHPTFKPNIHSNINKGWRQVGGHGSMRIEFGLSGNSHCRPWPSFANSLRRLG